MNKEIIMELPSEMIDVISKCEFNIIEPTINRIFTQASCEFIDPSHSDYMCKLYEPDAIPELYIDYKEKYNPKLWNGVIQCVNEDILMMKMFSIYTMEEYIQLNSSNRYIYIPILLSSPYGSTEKKENQQSINMTCLIIDNHTLGVYFLDSSGWINFFDTQVKSNTIQVIEKIFEKYFNDLSIGTGLAYRYISVMEWNPKNLNLLPNISNTLNLNLFGDKISSLNGIICMMFCHYLYDNKSFTVEETLNHFVELEDEEKIQLYIVYTKIFYQELMLSSHELCIDINNLFLNYSITEENTKQDKLSNSDLSIQLEIDNFTSGEQEKYITIRPKKKKVVSELDDLDELEKELFG
jgi:hypothetical protein